MLKLSSVEHHTQSVEGVIKSTHIYFLCTRFLSKPATTEPASCAVLLVMYYRSFIAHTGPGTVVVFAVFLAAGIYLFITIVYITLTFNAKPAQVDIHKSRLYIAYHDCIFSYVLVICSLCRGHITNIHT